MSLLLSFFIILYSGEKYQWESIEGGNWEIDFDTCNIYLTDNN